MFFRLHETGKKYIYIGLSLTIILFFFSKILSSLMLLITIYIYYFFRDPIRYIPNDVGIISPADGTIVYSGKSYLPDELKTNSEVLKISIFMSVFNVHVNRIPDNGTIKDIKYIKGSFFNASFDKSSKKNERNIIILENKFKEKIVFVQIAGLIARRIVCKLNVNQDVIRGRKFGIIKFGSRVDIYVPKNYKINVTKNQKVKGGETILFTHN